MPRQIIADSAAVATGHPLGARAGHEILQAGGNAVDAAVAAMLALCVVIPGSVGLGGYGGSAVIFRGDDKRKITAVDFDSCAPLAYCDGVVTADPQSSLYGARSVTVPAVVAGLDLVLHEHGTKSWADVSQPAIRLAEEGFELDSEHQRYLDRCAPQFDPHSLAVLFRSEKLPRVGFQWRQPELARLLQRLADQGPAAFYEGVIPGAIVRFLSDRGGIISEDDFRAYRPQVCEPLAIEFGGVDLYTPPPPSGGITALQTIQTMEQLLADSNVEPWSGLYFHLLAEALKTCWRERQQMLGDPDFVSIDFAKILSGAAAEARREDSATN